jgi:hypothetical protein
MHVVVSAAAAAALLACVLCAQCGVGVHGAVPPTAVLQWHAQSSTCALSSTDAVVQFYTSMCLRGDVLGLFNASLFVKASCTASSAVSVAFFRDAACTPSAAAPPAPNMTFGLACAPLNASSGAAASAAAGALPLYVLGACGGVPSAYDLTQTVATVHSYVGDACSGIIGARAYLPTACVRYANSSVQRTCSAVGNTTTYAYSGSSACAGTAGPAVSVQNARCQALPLANGTVALPFARLICGYDAFVDNAAPAARPASLALLAALMALACMLGS